MYAINMAAFQAGLGIVAGVSPSGKARGFDPRIRKFESCYPSHYLTH